MKELFKKYEIATETANEIDAAWETDPENETLEKAFDTAYQAQYNAFIELVNEIVTFTNGQIDKKTAATMIRTKYNELKNLIDRLA